MFKRSPALVLIILVTALPLLANNIPLWKVESKEGGIVYLMGSIHLLKESLTPFRDPIEKAYEQSDCLVVEAHIGSKNMLENTTKLMTAGNFKEGESLETFLTVENFSRLKGLLSEMGFDINGYLKQRPWMVAMTVSSLSMIKQGYNPLLGVDLYFINRAEQADKPIDELEGVDYQVQLFTRMTVEEELAFLFNSLQDQQKETKLVDEIIDSWKRGNIERLTQILEEKKGEEPALEGFYQSLLQKRNSEMSQKIDGYLKGGKKAFVVVGAAHLIGDSGIASLLKAKGYRVTLQ